MKKEQLIEQVHAECGGRIALVASKKRWELVCIKCVKHWTVSSPFYSLGKLPKDFEDVKNGVMLTSNP